MPGQFVSQWESMERSREFISERIRPLTEGADTAAMAAGGPGLPRAFKWRDETLSIATVLETWRKSGPCAHGSGEAHARKHWFEVMTTTGRRAAALRANRRANHRPPLRRARGRR